MSRRWTADELLQISRTYQGACVLAAAADLDVFGALAHGPLTADEAARRLGCGRRGTGVLLDALAALDLVEKRDGRYRLPDGAQDLLSYDSPRSVLPMILHHANCLRRWAQLPVVVKQDRPAERTPSVRGEHADLASFIGGMHVLSEPVANEILRALQPPRFRHFLDIGGASGSWTIAFLRAAPAATATLFDLPEVLPLAERRLCEAGLRGRVTLAGGDFMKDPLPGGADLAWVSAIIHSLSREENRRLFVSVHRALVPDGTIAVRDVVMDPDRTSPVAGALFAVNMLVGTEGGGTYTFEELREDLEAAGFADVALARKDEGMHSIVTARNPG